MAFSSYWIPWKRTERWKNIGPSELPQPSDNEELFSVYWTEKRTSMGAVSYRQGYSALGTREEIEELLRYLATKGPVFEDLRIIPRDEVPTDRGHVHLVDGVHQDHSWEDCPYRVSPWTASEL